MDNDRKKHLEKVMNKFNKSEKNNVLSFGADSEERETISTGIKPFDKFIGGGVKRGSFTVVYGGESVGKSTLVLQAIANAQKEGKIACYVDLEHTFSKERAIQLGVNIDDLVLAEQCDNAEQALEIIRTLCKEKVVDVIAIDSIQAMATKGEKETKSGKEKKLTDKTIAELARVMSDFFKRVSPDVFRAKASVIMIGQVRIAGIGSFFTHATMSGGQGLKHWAYVRCFIRRGQKADSPVQKIKQYYLDPDGKLRYHTVKTPVGFDSVIKLEKTKSSKSFEEGSEIHLPFLFKEGFVNEFDPNKEIPVQLDPKAEGEELEKLKELLLEKDEEEAKKAGIIKKKGRKKKGEK